MDHSHPFPPVMQLFVLPPAWRLPSSDAECVAAAALLQLRAREAFKIIPAHTNTETLPYLIDGSTHVVGFSAIARHLALPPSGSESTELDAAQRADSLAVIAFIEAHAQTLVDISLYVSSENYRHTTRPAFTKSLPWWANYIIPPQRRAAARTRTDHLGVSSIDVDNVHEDMSNRPPGFDGVGKEQAFEAETQKRASLILPRKETIRSLLQRPEHAAVFKLHALADAFFEPVRDLLGENDNILHTPQPQAVDCLLYGFLSLMLCPSVPQDWLSSTMRTKYPSLVAYTERLHNKLGMSTEVEHVLASKDDSTHQELTDRPVASKPGLSWAAPQVSTAPTVISSICNAIFRQIPVIGSSQLELLHAQQLPWITRHLTTLVLSTTASSVALAYLAIRTGFLVWPHGNEIQIIGRKRLSDYGHLGAALAGVSLLGPQVQAG